MLEHGGGVIAASKRYGIPADGWLDLSTGINPNGWPVPQIPPAVWRRLPEAEDGLIAAASAHYQTDCVLPVAGSQAVIQTLPKLRAPCRVGVLAPSYNEHRHAWLRANHAVENIAVDAIDAAIARLDVMVICNPNNPTAVSFAPETLLAWCARLAARGGWLIVDEAFVDATPALSVARHIGESGLIVLRSIGKFFGLAGIRVGFLLAWQELLSAVQSELGPWAVSGPGRWVATQALKDRNWQIAARDQLHQSSQRLQALLSNYEFAPSGSAALFVWVQTDTAAAMHEALARQGILARYFATPTSIRFGLPGDPVAWRRLEQALRKGAVILERSSR